MTPLNEQLATDVYEAVVSVCGETLYWKRTLKRVLRQAGVAQRLVERVEHLTKFQMAREVLDALDNAGPRGRQVQRNLVNLLANLAGPEDRVPDIAAGDRALQRLREAATRSRLLVDPEQEQLTQRRDAARAAREERSERRTAIDAVRNRFVQLHRSDAVQSRGYEFERLLRDLFRLHELEYSASYKTDTDQIDGSIVLDAFTYLLEARWRAAPASDIDLGILTHKVERRIDATRGMFISVAGFRAEAAALYRQSKENRLILVDGQDLQLILEGRFDLLDALREKIRAAWTRGEPYLQLATL